VARKNFQTILTNHYILTLLGIALFLTLVVAGPANSPGRFLLQVALFSVLVFFTWPSWLLVIGFFVMVGRFLLGPLVRMDSSEIVSVWQQQWGNDGASSLEYVKNHPKISVLSKMPRGVVKDVLIRERDLDRAASIALEQINADRNRYARLPWKRWIAVFAIPLLIIAYRTSSSGESSDELAGREVFIQEEVSPEWITIKYRPTAVNVSNGYFYYWQPEIPGNLLEAWWDRYNNYLIVNLRGTNYHYCSFSEFSWTALRDSARLSDKGGVDSYFRRFIRGSDSYDCRLNPVPEYPL
jgi:hypothetical protein